LTKRPGSRRTRRLPHQRPTLTAGNPSGNPAGDPVVGVGSESACEYMAPPGEWSGRAAWCAARHILILRGRDLGGSPGRRRLRRRSQPAWLSGNVLHAWTSGLLIPGLSVASCETSAEGCPRVSSAPLGPARCLGPSMASCRSGNLGREPRCPMRSHAPPRSYRMSRQPRKPTLPSRERQ
jgi:hypothetical protein